ncbi:MAG: MATE family efflux transporter [Lentisphaeria bacterium]|nr:MATE family efflux transporter [Lentisphaeria bacterium]
MQDKTTYNLFTNRDIAHLVIPLFIEQLLFMLVGTADTFMVASLGEASISAVALADMFNNLVASILFAIATGGAVVVSQSIGARNITRAKESAKQLLAMLLVSGFAVSVLTEVFLQGIVHLFYGNLGPGVYSATMIYFRITLAGLPFVAVYGGCAAVFRSMNRAMITMYISLASNLINIIGNAILIYGARLGVAGAAYATLFSRIFAMGVILELIADRKCLVHVDLRKGYRMSWMLMKKILYLGIPGGIENGVFQFGRVIVLGLVASYGTSEIAANAVAKTIDYFGCIPGNAFGLAVVTVIGQAVGRGDVAQIRYYVRKMMKWTYSSHVIWQLIVFALTPFMLSCFSKIDGDTRRLALYLILFHNGIGLFIWPMSFVFPNMLRSMNDVRWPMAISLVSMFSIRVGLSYVIAGMIGSGVIAVWIAMICDWCVRIIGFLLRYKSNAWIRLAHCHE